MSFFGKRKKQLPEPVHEEAIVLNASDLEHMVAEVYKDKLALEDELARAKNEVKQHSDMMTRCQAAEILARKLQDEKTEAANLLLSARRECENWQSKCQKAEDKATALALKIDGLERDAMSWKREIEQEVTGDVLRRMLDDLTYENGNWSKARVKEFVERFMPHGTGIDEQ